ncbi:hypothetical protein AB0I28_13400 [Phytomonospora sp. NPDC050363]|uniref:hypothetical protein n=1 Tax=Phytomonospora sp. NPDC050363 TaxID=3155642 RepID=UPI0034000C95
MRKRILPLLATTAAALAISLAAAAPAHAGTNGDAGTIGSGSFTANAGTLFFAHDGEIFYVEDNHADGAGVIAYWWIGSTYQGEMYNGGGANTSKTFNKSVTDGLQVRFQVCVSDNGSVKTGTCSAIRSAIA